MKTPSLTARLLGATTLALMAAMALIALLSYAAVTHFPRLLLESDFTANAGDIAEGLVYNPAGIPVALKVHTSLASAFEVLDRDILYRVVNAQGQALLPPEAQVLAPAGRAFDPALTRFDLVRENTLLHVATFPLDRPGTRYYLQIARSERFQQALTHNDGGTVRMAALATIGLALLVFIVMVLYTFNRLLKPLHAASQAAASITPGNLQTRLSTQGMPSELTPLITALNGALERLAIGYQVQQEFLATVAHELKTPLALMRGTVELGDSPDRATLLADIDGMSRHVQQLLQLAECSETQNYTIGPTDAAAAVADAIAKLDRLALSRGVAIGTPLTPVPYLIEADRGALFILIRNLLENAIQHAPRGGTVEVELNARGLSVRDYGVGISAQERPLLFRRYWRGSPQNHGGTGLGLAICLQIVLAHGWSISCEDAEPGARFWVGFHQFAE